MNRLASRLGISRSAKKPTFQQWADTVTTGMMHGLSPPVAQGTALRLRR